jgi:hypothetical protein
MNSASTPQPDLGCGVLRAGELFGTKTVMSYGRGAGLFQRFHNFFTESSKIRLSQGKAYGKISWYFGQLCK